MLKVYGVAWPKVAPSALADPSFRAHGIEILSLSKSYSIPGWRIAFAVGNPDNEVPMDQVIDQLIEIVAVRNPDLYEDGKLGSL